MSNNWKFFEVEGIVVAKNASEKELPRKSGGVYSVHSFVLKVEGDPDKNGNVETDEIAFKTIQSNVITEANRGCRVLVKAVMSCRAWKKNGEYFLKEDDKYGDLYQCFPEFYARAVEVIDSSGNVEGTIEHNQKFINEVSNSTDNEEDTGLPF